MVFEENMDFTRKARFVSGGHQTEPPESATYVYVVSRDSAHVALLLSALNDVDTLNMEIQGAYLNITCKDKAWFRSRSELGLRKGIFIIIFRFLYGTKSTRAAY